MKLMATLDIMSPIYFIQFLLLEDCAEYLAINQTFYTDCLHSLT